VNKNTIYFKFIGLIGLLLTWYPALPQESVAIPEAKTIAFIPASPVFESSSSLRVVIRSTTGESVKHLLLLLADNEGRILSSRPADASGTVVFDQVDPCKNWVLATISPLDIALEHFYWEQPLQQKIGNVNSEELEMFDLARIVNLQTGRVIANTPISLQSWDGSDLIKTHTNEEGLVIFEKIISNRSFKVSTEGSSEPDLFIMHLREMHTIPLQRPLLSTSNPI
jgi:hypothetical protein